MRSAKPSRVSRIDAQHVHLFAEDNTRCIGNIRRCEQLSIGRLGGNSLSTRRLERYRPALSFRLL